MLDEFAAFEDQELILDVKLREALQKRFMCEEAEMRQCTSEMLLARKKKQFERHETVVNASDCSSCEPSSPGRIIAGRRLNQEQKKDKKRIRRNFQTRMMRYISKYLWGKFDLLQNIKPQDILEVQKTTTVEQIWSDVF